MANDGDVPTTMSTQGSRAVPRSADGAHYLVVAGSPGGGARVGRSDEPLKIGRRAGLGLFIDDPLVSGWHCTAYLVGNVLVIEDAGSTNGTYLDGSRFVGEKIIPIGSSVQIGDTVLLHEYRSRNEVREQESLSTDVREAARYVRSLLPAPIEEGPMTARWSFLPSAHLGGDSFGYHRLDDHHWAIYLLDVCGHGAGAALHSVSVLNVLRQESLRIDDFADPAQVLAAVNDAFPMEEHSGMFLSIWYGVYDTLMRKLRYCSGGHPPALLIHPDQTMESLSTDHPPVGIESDTRYESLSAVVPAGSTLYVFSDGVYEIAPKSGGTWTLQDFRSFLQACPKTLRGDPEQIRAMVQAEQRVSWFQDDFSLLVFGFSE